MQVFGTQVVEREGLVVEWLAQPAISYALVHNKVPLVRRVALTNGTGRPLHGIRLQVELLGPDGPLVEPWASTTDVVVGHGREIAWDSFPGLGRRLAARVVNEAFPIEFVLTVSAEGLRDLQVSAPSRLLAHNEWFNVPSLYETVAAFVQPNTPAVETVLRAAARLLVEQTGSGALNGYQSGPQRAVEIAGAIYEALRGVGIHYQQVPASFELSGQKIRPTAAVLADRLGNCLDLSVTYAACLEQAGLRPVIWFIKGHAFGGFFPQEQGLPSPVVLEPNLLISLVNAGQVVPLELTLIGPRKEPVNFRRAVQVGTDHFREPDLVLHGAVDINCARANGVLPLPALPSQADLGAIDFDSQDEEPQHAEDLSLPPGSAWERLREHREKGDDPPPLVDESPLRVQKWKKSLLDLSLRNPLLSLPSTGKGIELVVPENGLALLDDLVHAGKSLSFVPHDAITELASLTGIRTAADLPTQLLHGEMRQGRLFARVTSERYKTALRALQRDARTLTQESGSNYLYLALGTLVHRKSNGDPARAPLFLLPVRIEGGTGNRPFTMAIDDPEGANPNHCLVEWLKVKHDVEIPELSNPPRDDSGIDIPLALAAISERLVHHRLDYRVEEAASVRLLQFATFQMWRDLDEHWPTFLKNPVIRHLVETPASQFDDPAGDHKDVVVGEPDLRLPIPADGSQMRAIRLAEQGRSFVLEGPPGTGKSQTITNLIAQALATGRTVLFVAEKQAALDVVKRRLTGIGLAPFTLDLHGRKQAVTAIREQLRDALEQQAEDDESTWAAIDSGYRSRIAPLVGYPGRVHAPNEAGLSVWTAFEATVAFGEGPTARIPEAHLRAPASNREQVLQALREFPAAADSARLRREHPWSLSGLRAVDRVDDGRLLGIAADLERVRVALQQESHLADLLRRLTEPDQVQMLLPAAELAARGELPVREVAGLGSDPGWNSAVQAAADGVVRFHADFGPELEFFRPDVLSSPDLDRWHAGVAEAARKLLGRQRRLQGIGVDMQAFTREGTSIASDHVENAVTRLLAARAAAGELYRQVQALPGLTLPPSWRPTDADAAVTLVRAQDAILTAHQVLRTQPEAWETLTSGGVQRRQVEMIIDLARAWTEWRSLLQCGAGQLHYWAGEHGWFQTWQRDGRIWYDELTAQGLLPVQRWGQVADLADVLTVAGLGELCADLLDGRIDRHAAEEAYQRGVAVTALAERRRTGDLEYFDPSRHAHQIADFTATAGRLRRALPEHAPAQLVRRRPFGAQDRGRIADFAAELRRKRGGKSFRDLFSTYPDIVTAITPCVLVSPASAATFLAPDAAQFDLVIFDEASQIRVAEAIGAMGRGRAAVIVGDSKQMPPTNLMLSTTDAGESEAEAAAPEDLDSILTEALEARLPRHWLTWHYRSRDESLIVFSNHHYYDAKLSSLPSPGASSSSGVFWRRLDGSYDRGRTRTNRVEAEAIVSEIVSRLHDPARRDQSIGVVTMNVQQRDLILDLLEDSPDPLIRERLSEAAEEPIFVKNLENVQGDERDVVLFSLAFSRDPATGKLPLNFGPLIQAGGERRLNVAITRARSEVTIFASFDPSDIDLARTSSVGLQHLRAYCELARDGVRGRGDLATRRAERRDPVRELVAEQLRSRGYEVVTGHGLSDFSVDLAVRAPGTPRWQVAVVLDGPRWAARPTVADRECAPDLLRDLMGWPRVVRFWLPAWLQDPEAVLDGIAQAVDEAAAAVPDQSALAEPESELISSDELVPPLLIDVVQDTRELHRWSEGAGERAAPVTSAGAVRLAERPPALAPMETLQVAVPRFTPYSPTRLGEQQDLARLASDGLVRDAVRRLLDQIVETEGPVEQYRMARHALACFGFSKTSEDRKIAVLQLVDPELTRTHQGGTFIWPRGVDPATWRGFRVSDGSADRSFDEIPVEEIANAYAHAEATNGVLPPDDLARRTMELLGYRRMTEKVGTRLRLAHELHRSRCRSQAGEDSWDNWLGVEGDPDA